MRDTACRFTATPNTSFDRSGNRAAFMREAMLLLAVRRARLIRALGASTLMERRNEAYVLKGLELS
jgi:hypothetical protein